LPQPLEYVTKGHERASLQSQDSSASSRLTSESDSGENPASSKSLTQMESGDTTNKGLETP